MRLVKLITADEQMVGVFRGEVSFWQKRMHLMTILLDFFHEEIRDLTMALVLYVNNDCHGHEDNCCLRRIQVPTSVTQEHSRKMTANPDLALDSPSLSLDQQTAN